MKQLMNVMVKMRDGVSLSTDIRMPEAGGPFPVVLVRNPYNNNITVTPENEALLKLYLESGYAYVTQDVRGKYDSEGTFRPFDESEDGFDSVAWLAKQTWCNGRVGMSGASYCGFTQLEAAKMAPPALCAITPSVMAHDAFKGIMYKNGSFSFLIMAWALGNTGRTDKPQPLIDWMKIYNTLPLEKMDAAAGFETPFLQEWLAHPRYDAFWKKISTEAFYKNFDTPAYIMGGWYDYAIEGTVKNYCGLKKAMKNKKVKLLIGPWAHGLGGGPVLGQLDFGPEAVFNIEKEKKRWLDRFVKGEKNGIEKEPPVRIFVMGANKWRNEEAWPLKRTKYVSYYISSTRGANSLEGDGVLEVKLKSAKEKDEFIYNPADPVTTIGGATLLPDRPAGPYDQTPIERRPDVLVYTTGVLKAPIEVTGFVKAELFIASSAPDTDFITRLCDVHPEGKSIVLSEGLIRARFRKGLDKEVMLKAGQVYKLELEMDPTSNVFLAGHKIRLEITSSSFPAYSRNTNTGKNIAKETKFKTAKQTVYHSNKYRSKLILPVFKGDSDFKY